MSDQDDWEKMLDSGKEVVVTIDKSVQQQIKQRYQQKNEQSKVKNIKKKALQQQKDQQNFKKLQLRLANKKLLLQFKHGYSQCNCVAGNQKINVKKQADAIKLAKNLSTMLNQQDEQTIYEYFHQLLINLYMLCDKQILTELIELLKVLKNQRKKTQKETIKKEKKNKKPLEEPVIIKKTQKQQQFILNQLASKQTNYKERTMDFRNADSDFM